MTVSVAKPFSVQFSASMAYKIKVQQRAVRGTQEILKSLMDGMATPAGKPIIVADLVPSQMLDLKSLSLKMLLGYDCYWVRGVVVFLF